MVVLAVKVFGEQFSLQRSFFIDKPVKVVQLPAHSRLKLVNLIFKICCMGSKAMQLMLENFSLSHLGGISESPCVSLWTVNILSIKLINYFLLESNGVSQFVILFFKDGAFQLVKLCFIKFSRDKLNCILVSFNFFGHLVQVFICNLLTVLKLFNFDKLSFIALNQIGLVLLEMLRFEDSLV